MGRIPGYGKIRNLGSPYTEHAFRGEVIVQEKVDGSQFRWGLNEAKELVIASKNITITHPDENKMFKEGVTYIQSIEHIIQDKCLPNTWFYGEYLQKPKHNSLKYERTPKNHIVLFDMVFMGKYASREELEFYANLLDIEVIPEYYVGSDVTVDMIKEFCDKPSFLGGDIGIEGCVIKNYEEMQMINGFVFPLFTKYVRPLFRETHDLESKGKFQKKDSINDWIQSFNNENRWEKAVIHLRERGLLKEDLPDIGPLIKEIQSDIVTEEAEAIKQYLYQKYIEDIKRTSVKGFVDWYKNKLIEDTLGKE